MPVRSGKVTAEAAARLPRQTIDQTWADLLDAAIRIVNEYVTGGPRDGDPPVDLLPFLRLEEVLDGASELARQRLEEAGRLRPKERVAPLTPGAFYRAIAGRYPEEEQGGTITAFRRIVTRQIVIDVDVYIDLGKRLAEAGHTWSEAVRRGMGLGFHRWAQTPSVILMCALALHARDKDVAAWSGAVGRRHVAVLIRLHKALLPIYRRRMRPGLSVADMAMAVSDLIVGMLIEGRFAPAPRNKVIRIDADGSGPKDWHVCALAAYAIYDRFTEPDEPETEEPVHR
jgi:hypothetical protein